MPCAMRRTKPSKPGNDGMTLVAELWREVGKHLELEESVRRIAPLLGEHLPIDWVLVRRLENDPARLITVADTPARDRGPVPATTTRSELDASEAKQLKRFLDEGRAVLVDGTRTPGLARTLLPSGVQACAIAAPLVTEQKTRGVLLLCAKDANHLRDSHVSEVQALIEPLCVALENDQRLHELSRLREALEADRRALLSRLERQDITDTVVGDTEGLRPVMLRVEQVAPTDAPVLILGETGSGKEVIARSIHARSRRAQGPVVRVNCGAIPANLIDSELFGHERGSFTGAVATRKGWFERADGGTLFLDEIGELPLEAQVRLLRVLQDGSLERVGSQHAITVDVRIVAATHRNLETMVAQGTFREDLWYRISVFPIRLPALRERPEDIPALAKHFAKRAGLRLSGVELQPTASDIALLQAYPWPGNVRELAAVIERAAILGDGRRLDVAKALGSGEASRLVNTPPPRMAPSPEPHALPTAQRAPTLDDAMVAHIERTLRQTHGRIEGPFGAAKALGINPHTLRSRMRKLGIDWAKFRGVAV
jgi:hydrogenase-4 transcriptional activator